MQPVPYIPFAFPGIENVSCIFTTRQGGQSQGPFATANISLEMDDDPQSTEANRQRILKVFGFSIWHELHQEHGTQFICDPAVSRDQIYVKNKGDALSTSASGQALVIQTADCQPVMLAHRSGEFIAALHVGWRGNRAKAPIIWVGQFCDKYGLSPQDILAVRGPSLGPSKSEFIHFDQEWGHEFENFFDEHTRTLNLWRLTSSQLQHAGIPAENIFGLDLCTFSLRELFFSYRRDGICGRQAGLIWRHDY